MNGVPNTRPAFHTSSVMIIHIVSRTQRSFQVLDFAISWTFIMLIRRRCGMSGSCFHKWLCGAYKFTDFRGMRTRTDKKCAVECFFFFFFSFFFCFGLFPLRHCVQPLRSWKIVKGAFETKSSQNKDNTSQWCFGLHSESKCREQHNVIIIKS